MTTQLEQPASTLESNQAVTPAANPAATNPQAEASPSSSPSKGKDSSPQSVDPQQIQELSRENAMWRRKLRESEVAFEALKAETSTYKLRVEEAEKKAADALSALHSGRRQITLEREVAKLGVKATAIPKLSLLLESEVQAAKLEWNEDGSLKSNAEELEKLAKKVATDLGIEPVAAGQSMLLPNKAAPQTTQTIDRSKTAEQRAAERYNATLSGQRRA